MQDMRKLEEEIEATPHMGFELCEGTFYSVASEFRKFFGKSQVQTFVKNGGWKAAYGGKPLPQRGLEFLEEGMACVDLRYGNNRPIPVLKREDDYLLLALKNELADQKNFFTLIDELVAKPERREGYRNAAVWCGQANIPQYHGSCHIWFVEADRSGLYVVSTWNATNSETKERETRTKKLAILKAS